MSAHTPTPGFFTLSEQAQHQIAYDNELVRRYEAGESLTKTDRKEARKMVKARAAIARATVSHS